MSQFKCVKPLDIHTTQVFGQIKISQGSVGVDPLVTFITLGNEQLYDSYSYMPFNDLTIIRENKSERTLTARDFILHYAAVPMLKICSHICLGKSTRC